MKIQVSLGSLCILVFLLVGCNAETPPAPATFTLTPSALFIDTKTTEVPTSESTARLRLVGLNLALLLGPEKEALSLEPNAEIVVNLFPNVIYIGVIERIEEDAGSITWLGHLKDIEYSELLMIYTSGIFIGHFASPEGVYEVSSAGGDLYNIVSIDQTEFQDH